MLHPGDDDFIANPAGVISIKKIVRQEWNQWQFDAFYPMHYNDFYLESPEWDGEVTKEGVNAIESRVPLYNGLFICPDPAKKTAEKDP